MLWVMTWVASRVDTGWDAIEFCLLTAVASARITDGFCLANDIALTAVVDAVISFVKVVTRFRKQLQLPGCTIRATFVKILFDGPCGSSARTRATTTNCCSHNAT